MIELTKLDNQTFMLNALYIEQVQAFPDTTVTLINGKKIVVKETVPELVAVVEKFYQTIGLAPSASAMVIKEEDH